MTKGFTLIELLLVIGMIAILSTMAAPVGLTFYRSQAVDGARSEMLEALTKARHNAVFQKYDSRYGVKISTTGTSTLSSFTLYKGTDYTHRDDSTTYDELYVQPANINISATGSSAIAAWDINFSKLVGTTTATGTITLTHASGNETRYIIIDALGNAYATSSAN